jgi:leucine dehydrogenase
MPLIDQLFEGATWARVIAIHDADSGLRAFVVIDSWARGPAFGGIRRRAYASESDALADALALAAAMTRKCALAELPAGGAKTVVIDHPGFAREPGYLALGRAIDQLEGRYVCGPDVGTGEAELAHVRRATRHVNPAGNDAGAATARGVLAGLHGVVATCFGTRSLAGLRVVIEGLGAVGSALAAALLDAGAQVHGFDLDAQACARAAARGVQLLAADRLYEHPCDVFMPCALGRSLTRERVARATWRAVCGSANNQIATPEVELDLHARGIAWAPDELVSAGAVIEGVYTVAQGEAGRAAAARTIAAIADTCAQLLVRSRAEDRPPGELARALAAQRVAMSSAGSSSR